MEKVFNKIIKWSIYSSVFLMPIFFLPITYEPFEFNKQYLLALSVSIGILAWLIKMVLIQKEVKFRWFALNIPVLIFLLFAILSTIFSIEKLTSVFGFYGRFSGSLIEIIFLVLFYFLLINNVKIGEPMQGEYDNGEVEVPGIIKSFLWSIFSVVIISFLSTFGAWQLLDSLTGKANFHLSTFFSRIFNTVSGSPSGMAIFLAIALTLVVSLFFQKQNSAKKILFLSFLALALTISLIIIDFTPAWIILGLSMLAILIFAFWSRIFREKINWLLIPILLFVVSFTFLFIQTSRGPSLRVLGFNILAQPKEIVLSQATTWKTVANTVKTYPVLGSGPSTFVQDFSKLKPHDFNKDLFWQIRFDRGASQIAEIIMTMGILGILAWIGIIGIALFAGYLLISKIKKDGRDSGYQLPLFFTLIALFIAQLVYYQTVTLSFLFWLMLGLSAVSWFQAPTEKRFSFGQFPELGLVFGIFLILVILGFTGIWFFAGRFYIADVQYRNGIVNNNTNLVEKAVALNGLKPGYRIVLSRFYFSDAVKTISSDNDQQNIQTAQGDFAKSIIQAKTVVAMSPNWVVGPENLGMIYRDLRGYIKDVSSFAIDSFNKAEKLEPYNPVLLVEVGKLYKYDQKYNEAEKEFEKALILKPDYDDAKIQLALTLAAQGKTNDAIAKLKDVTQASPSNIDAHLQLGILYYNNLQVSAAVDELQKVLSLSPNNANALYVLGLSYNKQGDKDNALKALKRVLELNPDNADVLSKISEISNPPKQEQSKK